MKQTESRINEIAVTGRKFKRLVSIVPQNWIRTDPAWIAEKYKLKSMNFRKFEPIDKNRILSRGKSTMDETFILTEKYDNFNGRIITNESILYDGDKEESIRAEWDCGATYSSISKELAEKLKLKPCGTQLITSTTGSDKMDVYEISLILHDEVEIPMIVSALPNIYSHDVDMIIGMNVIHLGDFAISNYNDTTCFSFRCPSQGLIDFTKE